jgi:hypothetical protein
VSDVAVVASLALDSRKVEMLALNLRMLALVLRMLALVARKGASQIGDARCLALSEGECLIVGIKDGREVERKKKIDKRKW